MLYWDEELLFWPACLSWLLYSSFIAYSLRPSSAAVLCNLLVIVNGIVIRSTGGRRFSFLLSCLKEIFFWIVALFNFCVFSSFLPLWPSRLKRLSWKIVDSLAVDNSITRCQIFVISRKGSSIDFRYLESISHFFSKLVD